MPSDKFSGNVPLSPSSGTSSKTADVASQVKSKGIELGHSAAAQIDNTRSAAAGGIASAAASLHGHADELPGGQRVASMAHSAADKLSSTADYIRAHDMDAMVKDIQALVKKNPGPALLGASVIGFLLGKSFSSRD